ncbi:hypothetical protein EUGRSUZ_H01718 [Eucalyptus grandis]|uniref:Uncharacterized protein n=2 Tax=Eucalyptus grandis TaxID=71139 RepID=A0ACC3JQJ1_EUCGR|nr:hypothetical protein EUGRSUZ_H01718 [Eucalyptus grandis]
MVFMTDFFLSFERFKKRFILSFKTCITKKGFFCNFIIFFLSSLKQFQNTLEAARNDLDEIIVLIKLLEVLVLNTLGEAEIFSWLMLTSFNDSGNLNHDEISNVGCRKGLNSSLVEAN